MCLVDDHDVVVGDHRHALDGVDGQQRVVGDDQVGALGLLAGGLDEALLPEGAAAGAEALAMTHRDLPPLAVGVPRRVVALAGAVVLGLLLGPGAELEHLAGHRADRHVDQGPLVVGDALADAVQAGIVGAALQHGVRRVDAVGALAQPVDGRDQPRDVALDELVLQRQGGGGDHDAALVEQRGHEVAQRLARAGAGLDEQVLARLHRRRDRLGHLDLARPFLAADPVDRRSQHVVEPAGLRLAGGRGVGHPGTLRPRADSQDDALTDRPVWRWGRPRSVPARSSRRLAPVVATTPRGRRGRRLQARVWPDGRAAESGCL